MEVKGFVSGKHKSEAAPSVFDLFSYEIGCTLWSEITVLYMRVQEKKALHLKCSTLETSELTSNSPVLDSVFPVFFSVFCSLLKYLLTL